ncbi:MAG: ABC transporter ATP-binding protein [Chloroflexi bacterium]|nr:ABC transporter ATP-binding protein [Chloroflexota bacterium]MCI0578972.1 ABC transporter ATP-binding protein [Chloroflexota bacterium]MCI0645090.1 ABC transporter ATP-binding protein [Chloroflexota bacterium]MCI0731925.1 ABC transporter ATP-binding protein [Chloroflexota bacterium]
MAEINNPIAIEIQSLSKVYRYQSAQPVLAVDNLNLSVPAGQVLGFLGPNGAGKTTTIKMICGLVTPTAGRITLNSYDVAGEHKQAMKQIGAVLEGARNVYWRLSAWQNLVYFGRLKGTNSAGATGNYKERAERLLNDLGLWDRRHDQVRSFSRGMQQKVAIACALVTDPPILLFDEPTLGLDVQAARTVKEWVTRLAHEQGKTVVLTTHQLDVAQTLCQRIAIINRGRLITNKPVGELLELFRQEFYQIRLQGHWNSHQDMPWPGVAVQIQDGETHLNGVIADQATLYQLLDTVRETGLPLLAVNREEPNLEEVFTRLVTGEITQGQGHDE